jgi:CheY-like chemotaxis protein
MTGLLAHHRILVVEDEMLVLMNIEMALEDLGCSKVHAASTVAEALVLLEIHPFDAALLDVNLGGETSFPIADALIKRGIPFAFATGYGSPGDRRDLGDRPLLRKPYVRGDLISVFEQLLAGDALPAMA